MDRCFRYVFTKVTHTKSVPEMRHMVTNVKEKKCFCTTQLVSLDFKDIDIISLYNNRGRGTIGYIGNV